MGTDRRRSGLAILCRFSLFLRFAILAALPILVAAPAEAGYAAIVHEAQSRLAALGHDPGVLDGQMGGKTARAVTAYQTENGLTRTGRLDEATLQSLSIGASPDLANRIEDWRTLPGNTELQALREPVNDPANPYADYRPYAPAANLDLPGLAILEAMNKSADRFGSRAPGQPGHTVQGRKYATECLKTNYYPDHWSDITVHYYCQMSAPRRCYTNALSGKSTRGVKFSRIRAFAGCATGQLPDAADFRFVTETQSEIFQYLMDGQTHAFNHEQEQAVINAFYGVANPADRSECRKKRPRRTEDPGDGSHCLVDKTMSRKLIGRSR